MSRSTRKEPITDRNHVLNFGQFSGKSVAEIMEFRPSYLVWLHRNMDSFELDAFLLDEAEEGIDKP